MDTKTLAEIIEVRALLLAENAPDDAVQHQEALDTAELLRVLRRILQVDGRGIGRIRLKRIPDASAKSLRGILLRTN